MKLIIGNKNYSSWSLRGWLACKQSGLAFEEITVPLYGEDWDEKKKADEELAPSSGKVPILWDGDCVVWTAWRSSTSSPTASAATASGPRTRRRGAWRDQWSPRCIRATSRCAASCR
jgi:hypothetical protein